MLADHVRANREKEGGLCSTTNSRGILKLSRAELFTHDWLFYFGVGGSSFKLCGIYFRDDQSTFDSFVILKLDRLCIFGNW